MRLLDRYIVLTLLRHIALSMCVLLVLAGVFLFVNEQGWVGAGSYGQPQALRYVLAQLPATGLQFLPVAALLGALLAIGQLAHGSELTVMRAAGVSIAHIASVVALAGLVLLPAALLVGEWLAPPLAHAARVAKAMERDGSFSMAQGSAWVRNDGNLLRADAEGQVTAFELDDAGRLVAVTVATRVAPRSGGAPALAGAEQVRFTDRSALRSVDPQLPAADIDGAFFDMASADPRQQSLRELHRNISVREVRGQDARRERFAFWSSIARLAAVPLAMLLAVPMLLGFLRTAGTGARATLGLVLGLLYFIAQRIVESGTFAFTLDPLFAWLPAVLLGVAAAWLLWRAHRLSMA